MVFHSPGARRGRECGESLMSLPSALVVAELRPQSKIGRPG